MKNELDMKNELYERCLEENQHLKRQCEEQIQSQSHQSIMNLSLKEHQEVNIQLQKQNIDLENKIVGLNKEKQALKISLEEAKEEQEKWVRKCKRVQQELDDLQDNDLDRFTQLKDIKGNQQCLIQEKSELESKVKQLSNEIKLLTNEKNKLAKNVQDREEICNIQTSKIVSLTNELQEVKKNQEEQPGIGVRMNTTSSTSSTKLQDKDEKKLVQLQAIQIQDLQIKLAAKTKELDNSKKQYDQVIYKQEQLLKENNKLKQDYEAVKKISLEIQTMQDQSKMDCNKLMNEIKSIEEKNTIEVKQLNEQLEQSEYKIRQQEKEVGAYFIKRFQILKYQQQLSNQKKQIQELNTINEQLDDEVTSLNLKIMKEIEIIMKKQDHYKKECSKFMNSSQMSEIYF